jgi:magnesium transporter
MAEETRELYEEVQALAREERLEELRALLAHQRAEDVGDLIEHLPADARDVVFHALADELASDVLHQLDDTVREHVLDHLETAEITHILEHMPADEAADIVADLEPETAAEVLRQIPAEDAREVREILRYPPDTAGGIMSPDVVAIRADHTVSTAVDTIRSRDTELGDFYYVYVIGPRDQLVGVVSLKAMLLAWPEQRIAELMDPEVIHVPAAMDQEQVAALAARYDLLALPVVDEAGRLIGQVTIGEVMDVLEEEASEDMYRMVGLTEDESVFTSLGFSIRRRLPWLYVNLATAILAASVISFFGGTIGRLEILAALQAIVAGQGGNAGTQTLTIIVRSLALGELDFRNSRRALLKELGLGLVNGCAVGVGIGVIVALWTGKLLLGGIIAAAMLLNFLMASLGGVLVPLTLRACRLDPALASGVFVTTITDVCGFFFFLGLATLLIRYLV